ncbi:MAG: MFS transporter [Solirubrobacteraceae bacterium]
MRQCLRMPVFRRLLAAFVLNELTWAVGTLALSVVVYRRTGSAIGTAVFYICAQVLPALLSPALVAGVDRVNPRRVLPALYGTEALLFGALAYATHHFTLAPVLALVLVDGAVAGAARSLAAAARTEVLKPIGLLHEGNAISNLGFSLVYMGGPVLGGGVVVAGGTVAALLVNCAFFATMGLVLALTVLPQAASETDTTGALARLREGIAHARADRPLGRLLVMQTFGLVFFTVTVPVEVVYAQHTLRAGAGGYGVLMGAWGAGCVVGGGAYARWRRGSPTALIGGSGIALAVGFAVMAAAPSLGVALVGAAIAGAGNAVETVALRTAVQDRTPGGWMAIILGLSDSSAQLAPGLGYLLGGVITALTVTRVAFAVGAGGSLAFALAVPFVLGLAPAPAAGDEGANAPAAGAAPPGAGPRSDESLV